MRSILASFCLLVAMACGPSEMKPDDRTPDACARFTTCGECVGQPQCGFCITDGVGRCVANRGETNPSEPPEDCAPPSTWHYLIRDDQSLPEGAPYCPPVAPPEAADSSGGEELGSSETKADSSGGEEVAL